MVSFHQNPTEFDKILVNGDVPSELRDLFRPFTTANVCIRGRRASHIYWKSTDISPLIGVHSKWETKLEIGKLSP